MLSMTPRVPATEEGRSYFWKVDLWWKTTSDNSVQSGGHFGWKPGDRWLDVLQQVIELRGIDPAALTSVSISLEGLS
jgi:hypothetical protein